MKKISLIIALLLTLIAEVSAQNSVILRFTGRDQWNNWVPLTSVLVENQTKRWQEVLYYPDTILNLNTLGMDDYLQQEDVQIFQNVPNPFEGMTDFSLRLNKGQKVQLEIYDMKGALMAKYINKLPEGMHQFRATLTSPQTYLLSAKTLKDKLSIKMVNVGNGGANNIEYVGMCDEIQFKINSEEKGGTRFPFSNGDWMKYIGNITLHGIKFQSSPIVKSQTQSETIIFPFVLPYPSVLLENISNITSNSAVAKGNITSDGGYSLISKGVCWSTSQTPTIKDNHSTINGSDLGSFSSGLANLSPNTTYYVRAYATNIFGTAYSVPSAFRTVIDVPTVITSEVYIITSTYAYVLGNVTSTGGSEVTARGVCWSTSSNPTTSNSHTTNGSGAGSFTSSMTNLSPNTTYYVRAYATNSAGTAYGEQKSFKTSVAVPTVSTTSISNITATSATSGGNVTSTGGAAVTAKGICWSTSSNPTTSNSHTTNGSGAGSFTSSMASLSPNTTYYVRAYATNSAGTAYGEQKSFKTSVAVPTVSTTSISNITATSATSGGNVTSTGGAAVTAKGICWSTSSNPTTSNSHTTNGSGTGSFTSSMTNLSPNTTYYVRAYATNSKGTAYGEQRSFTTSVTLPTVTTSSVSNITATTATGGGNVTSTGGATVTAKGICWSTSSNPTISGNHTTDGSGTGSFTSSLTNLSPNTTYYVRAYATNSKGTAYGEQRSFTTSATLPTVTTTTPSNITATTATSGGNVTASGGATVTARGVCWSTSSNPTISGNHTTDGTGTGSFTSSLTNLSPGTTYYVRAYATNSKGTAYGEQRSFTTSATLPTVTTSSVSNITATTATGGGNVTSTGGATVTAKGICWSTSSNPTISGNHTTDGSGTGSFTSSMTNLSPNTTYYVRAYATNSKGTAYGEQMTFITLANLPTVITSSVSNITETTATGGGNVTSTGGAAVTARGICWSTSANPTISGNHTTDGSGTGSFTSSLTNLSPGTTYYVRAYATNSAGTAYGEQMTFIMLANLPTVITSSVSNITATTATGGGNVTSTGGATVTAKGICWSTSSNPTISGNHTTDGSGTGSFTSSMTNLNPGTTYYVRAYATNSKGTTYGEQMTFITLANLPTVITSSVSNITATTATGGGNVTSTGGAAVTARGVCWSTSSNPTISDNHTADGSGTGSFTSNMTNLSPNTTYYVRAYATNSAGTAYGEQKSFTTSATLPTVTTSSVSNITATSATGGGNVTSTGGATVTAKGICWSTSSNPTISGNHTTDGSGTGSFTSSLTNLSPGTTYYVRAYATNSKGTAYGEQKNFITLANQPTVTTASVTNITATTATGGGNVTSDGGATVTAKGICWSTSSNPTISGNHTTDGSGTGSFTSSMTNLSPNTTYYVRAYATNSKGTTYGELKSFITMATTVNGDGKPCPGTPTVTDHEGNVYNTVQIGTQCWTKENMRCKTSPRTGTTILEASPSSTSYTGKKAYYVNGNSSNTSTYGLLYNWNAAVDTFNTAYGETSTNTNSSYAVNVTFSGNRRGICPKGWHVPSDAEWTEMENYVGSQSEYQCNGSSSDIAKALASTTGWESYTGTSSNKDCYPGYNPSSNNATGFSVVPACNYSGSYSNFGYYASFWSATKSVRQGAYGWFLGYDNTYVGRFDNDKGCGFSVRCVKGADTTPPEVTTASVTNVMYNSANSGGNVTSDGGATVTAKGVCWSTSSNPTISGNHTTDGSDTGSFTSSLTNLSPNTTYYVRAYATNSAGTAYGELKNFTTLAAFPTVTTTTPSNVTSTSATSGGNVTSDGGATVTARGICWSTSTNPTISGNHTTDGSGTGSFTSSMTKLNPGTTYYVRAYATNSAGTAYGEQKNFTTLATFPTVTTTTPSNVTSTSATSGGNVTSDGGATVTARGVCWSTSTNPTISDNHTTDGSDTGSFTSSMTNLSPNTTYYVRAYATNSKGTAYGEQRSFTTSATLPTVTTSSVSNITATTATGGGNVTSTGGATVTAKGICWSTSSNPTISGNHTTDGSGTGSFTSSLTNLSPGTTYYVRAYATNSAGTAYGEQRSFTTSVTLPTVTTSSVSNITATSATGGGNVTSTGGATVTAKGICWSTSSNPTISGNHTTDGSGTGSFTSSMTNLSPGTTYYVRAYATNSKGTAYGEQRSFTTSVTLPTVTTSSVSNITATSATGGGNVTSTGGATVTAKGVCWSTSSNPTISGNQTTDGSGTGSFTSSLTNLSPGTTYYVRAYATNSAGTAYGEQKSFTTSATLPTVTTASVTNITATTATGGGNVTSDGGATVTAKGICWSTSSNPTISGNHTTDGSGTGSFTSSLTNLSPGTTYYVRAYATNSAGTVYGEQKSFTTSVPTFICGTSTVTDHEGNVYNTVQIGNQCWTKENMRCKTSPSTGTTILETSPSSHSYTGKIAYYMADDSSKTSTYGLLYNWNAAVDTFNTEYGETSINTDRSKAKRVTFSGYRRGICPEGWHIPSDAEWMQLTNYVKSQEKYNCGNNSENVAKALASSIGWNNSSEMCAVGNMPSYNNVTGFSAVPAGYHMDSHFYYYYSKACFWSATISKNSISSSYITKLNSYSDRVYRAAENMSNGYSVRCLRDEKLPNLTVKTISFTTVTSDMFICEGMVTSENDTAITARGVCWSKYPNPTICNDHIDDGKGMGNFTCSIKNLSLNTTYFVRAYATNSGGTSYGNEICFTTHPSCGTATDYDGNIYNTVYIGKQCWMKENLKTTHYSDGTVIILAGNGSSDIGYRYYPNNSSKNVSTYGCLYDWLAVMRNNRSNETTINGIQGICPDGWHMPSLAEMKELTDYARNVNEKNPENALRTTSWYASKDTPYTVENNVTGFSAVPAGYYSSSISSFGVEAYFWTTDQYDDARADAFTTESMGYALPKTAACSVRCLRDETCTPMVITNTLLNVMSSTATCGGEVILEGCAAVTARGVCWSTTPNPTINDSHTTDGSGVGIFRSSLTNLISGNTYYVRAYAINSLGIAYGENVIFTPSENAFICGNSTVKDHESNVYNTVNIGTQCWTKENMRCKTSPSTGTTILEASPSVTSYTGKKAYYPNNNASNVPIYGLLYNWNAAVDTFDAKYVENGINSNFRNALSVSFNNNRRGICPQGWHIPSVSDWARLETDVSSQTKYVCNDKSSYISIAKALASTTGWESCEDTCTVGAIPENNNATGFSAMPAGSYGQSFITFGRYAYFWSATQCSKEGAYCTRLLNGDEYINHNHTEQKDLGFSVRCVRD